MREEPHSLIIRNLFGYTFQPRGERSVWVTIVPFLVQVDRMLYYFHHVRASHIQISFRIRRMEITRFAKAYTKAVNTFSC